MSDWIQSNLDHTASPRYLLQSKHEPIIDNNAAKYMGDTLKCILSQDSALAHEWKK